MKRYLRDQKGITLIEVLVSIAILGIIMAMNTQLLENMITGSARQNALVTTQFESTLGLEIMRTDIEAAGLGLADDITAIATYNEADATKAPVASPFNDATTGAPRAIVHSNGVSATGYIANSDYLVIKSTAAGENMAARKWTYITDTNTVHVWGGGTPDPNLDMVAGDHMVVIRPRSNPSDLAALVGSSTSPFFDAKYQTAAYTSIFVTSAAGDRLMAYGVSDNHDASFALRMPFNRADYYIRQDSNIQNCAPGTGTLIKATVNHADGDLTEMPLITCVANMQVVFRLDTDGDGIIDSTVGTTPAMPALTALQIKQQVKEARVYLLAHEGPVDQSYTYIGPNPVILGDTAALGTQITLNATNFGPNWDHYRWKIYTLFVKPRSLY